MSAVAGVIVFKAQPGQGAEVARRISSALPAAQAESGTPLWLVLHSNADPDTVFLVDLFTGTESRNAHMQGDAAGQIFATVPPLLAADPELHPSDVIAHKGL